MQIPIPQSGERAPPSTENRHGSPAIITAAATLIPWTTRTGLPLTVMEIQLSLNRFSASAPACHSCCAHRASEFDLVDCVQFCIS
jgi:hypothetical protein